MDNRDARARAVYQTICKGFDDEGWKYRTKEEDLVLYCSMASKDLPIDHILRVFPRQQLVMLSSKLPMSVEPDKMLDMAIAVNVVNDQLADGSFDYYLEDGDIIYRQTVSFRGNTELGSKLFPRLVAIASSTVDEYNDKFFLLAKGMTNIEQFLAENL